MCENDVFVLPVNILTGVARQLLGPHDTLPCVLIYSTWVNHLQVYMEIGGMLCECIYMRPCDFRLWVTS